MDKAAGKLSANRDETLGRAIYAGAAIVADEIRREINALPVQNGVHGSEDRLLGSVTSVQAQAEAARETENLAQTMGMTTTEYQEWDYILKSVGYSAEQAQGDLSMLAERAMDAAEGVGEGAELFNKLGINVKIPKEC